MKYFILILSIFASALSMAQANNLQIGTKHTIESKVLDEKREIYVSLPEDYQSSNYRYPVLYLLDGKMNIKHVVGAVDILTESGAIPPLIVVAIPSTDRSVDFPPYQDANSSGGKTTRGKEYHQFIEKEVIKYIDGNYRTHSFRALQGHSLGGLFTVYSMIRHQDVFDAYMAIAPSLWWNGEQVIDEMKAKPSATISNKAMYLSIGENDGWGMRQELKKLKRVITEKEFMNVRVHHEEFKNEGHMSARYPANYYGLKFVFSDINLTQDLWDSTTGKSFTQHETKLVEKYGNSVKQSFESYLRLGEHLTHLKLYDAAVVVFERLVEKYGSIFGKVELAYAYRLNGQTDDAIGMFKTALKQAQETEVESYPMDALRNNIEMLRNPLAQEMLQGYVGDYKGNGSHLRITLVNGRLRAGLIGNDGLEDFEIFATSSTRFRIRVIWGEIEFVRNNEGLFDILMHANGDKLLLKNSRGNG